MDLIGFWVFVCSAERLCGIGYAMDQEPNLSFFNGDLQDILLEMELWAGVVSPFSVPSVYTDGLKLKCDTGADVFIEFLEVRVPHILLDECSVLRAVDVILGQECRPWNTFIIKGEKSEGAEGAGLSGAARSVSNDW